MQRALIVDDSKTAQLRLTKMMSRYDLTVDVAFSAEEALGYLSYRMPVVIFMDHHMEGMDGFEALKIIKANPTTATIPVIMYTAQKGDVYVGQARALGALDILTKEVIKPSNLERVLSSLKIYPKDKFEAVAVPVSAVGSAAVAPMAVEPAEPPPPPSPEAEEAAPESNPAPSGKPANHSDFEEVQLQIARLFELHIADVRQQISDQSRYMVRRLSTEIEKAADKEPTVGDVPLSVVSEEISADNRRAGMISGSLLILILLALGLLGYQLYDTRVQLHTLNSQYQNVVSSNQQSQALLGAVSANLNRPPESPPNTSLNTGITSALSWALDADLQFPFNGQPLNEQSMLQISTLVYRLASIGFEGMVEIKIHFGNFCIQHSDTGEMLLVNDDSPADKCLLLADAVQEFPINNYLSIPYLNFQDNAMPVKEGQIDLNLITTGTAEPRVPYPQNPHTLTAAQWNDIAAKNNRVTVDLSPL